MTTGRMKEVILSNFNDKIDETNKSYQISEVDIRKYQEICVEEGGDDRSSPSGTV